MKINDQMCDFDHCVTHGIVFKSFRVWHSLELVTGIFNLTLGGCFCPRVWCQACSHFSRRRMSRGPYESRVPLNAAAACVGVSNSFISVKRWPLGTYWRLNFFGREYSARGRSRNRGIRGILIMIKIAAWVTRAQRDNGERRTVNERGPGLSMISNSPYTIYLQGTDRRAEGWKVGGLTGPPVRRSLPGIGAVVSVREEND